MSVAGGAVRPDAVRLDMAGMDVAGMDVDGAGTGCVRLFARVGPMAADVARRVSRLFAGLGRDEMLFPGWVESPASEFRRSRRAWPAVSGGSEAGSSPPAAVPCRPTAGR